MKKIIFTLFALLAIVGVSNKIYAQDAKTPYLGGTYTYSMTGIDDVANTRTARVFIDAAASTDDTPDMAIASAYTVTSSLTVTSSTNYFDIAVPANTTSFSFDIAYATTGLTAGTTYNLVVVLYDGADTECHNYIYTTIVPATNDFNLVASVGNASICQVINNSTLAEDTPASASQQTSFTYFITKTGGAADDDWEFDLNFTDNSENLGVSDILTEANGGITASISTGSGAANSVNITEDAVGDYTIKVTNAEAGANASVVKVTITVNTETGSADADFIATIANAKIYDDQTSTELIATETSTADNSGTTTVKNLPTIGGFSGL